MLSANQPKASKNIDRDSNSLEQSFLSCRHHGCSFPAQHNHRNTLILYTCHRDTLWQPPPSQEPVESVSSVALRTGASDQWALFLLGVPQSGRMRTTHRPNTIHPPQATAGKPRRWTSDGWDLPRNAWPRGEVFYNQEPPLLPSRAQSC